MRHVVSNHYFRRTARAKRAKVFAAAMLGWRFRGDPGEPPPRVEVEQAKRGPYKWSVVRYSG